ncbi:MAG: OmpA family protein, partial [Bdellovibrionaceae bacterium]|nr:OmpA family protein [Bdellovibrio sp.]
EEEPENHDRWLVSYADFITLLFAFFVVMYATSTNNQEKQKTFENAVRVNLKLNGSGGGAGSGADRGDTGGENSSDSLIPLEGFPARSGPGETQEYVSRFIDKKLDASEKTKIQELRHDAVGVRVALASAQFFNPGGTKIKVEALQTLDKLAEMLKETDRKIVIEGHTDNTAVSKDAPYESNWELSSLRATSIVKYLIKYHQIEPNRMSAIAYGDTRPLKSNDSEEGRSQNRRIEIYIILDEKFQN